MNRDCKHNNHLHFVVNGENKSSLPPSENSLEENEGLAVVDSAMDSTLRSAVTAVSENNGNSK